MKQLKKTIDSVLWRLKTSRLPDCENMWPLPYKIKGAMRLYEKKMGYSFDFYHPVLFTEKLQYYRVMYDRPDFPNVVDKYLFKSYIAEKLGDGYTIPLYGAWQTVDGLREVWDQLPNELVLKSTLQSDGKCIKIIRDKSSVRFDELANELEKWLVPKNTLINSYCRAYAKATPRILAEEYMAQIDDQLYDYKVFCFNGVPHCFYVATDHFPGQLSHISFYDLNWDRLNVRYGEHPNCDVEKPAHFDEMLRIAEKLSEGFPFLRVDFFDVGEKVYLSELTLYPGAGQTPYHPESFNQELGDLFILPKETMEG